MYRMWMRSKGWDQSQGFVTSSTSRMQLGGTQVSGGGLRSTPWTITECVSKRFGPEALRHRLKHKYDQATS